MEFDKVIRIDSAKVIAGTGMVVYAEALDACHAELIATRRALELFIKEVADDAENALPGSPEIVKQCADLWTRRARTELAQEEMQPKCKNCGSVESEHLKEGLLLWCTEIPQDLRQWEAMQGRAE